MVKSNNTLTLVNLGIDTQHEFMIFLHYDCVVCRLEGFEALTRVVVKYKRRSIVATLALIHSDLLTKCQASLSLQAWNELGVQEGDHVSLSHLPATSSFKHVRAKIFGHALNQTQFDDIINDVVAGHYSNIEISSFITACARDNLKVTEITNLTKAMIHAGKQLHWKYPCIVDKHSVGGIPGNRTTPIVVAIVAAAGLIIPKTSSRAITSPAGTADTVETMTPVTLSIKETKRVIEKEGGCMIWGGGLGVSPADDIIIKVERPLDLDPEGQMIASVLSKKAAVGATHVIIDIPVGKTAKIRSNQAFLRLKEYFSTVGRAIGLEVQVIKTEGIQPLGKGIGPALEAKDILAVLRNDRLSPRDLREKALLLASNLLELCKCVPLGKGAETAKTILESGGAYDKFIAICEAQGGFTEPPTAPHQRNILSPHSGRIIEVDNRNIALIAKLAGAPSDKSAGIEFFTSQGSYVEKGQPLYRIHAETKGALNYSANYAKQIHNAIVIQRE